ncbi:MAG: tyrosine recombinase XerC [Betaproteobacteria bacterium]|nr:tyrosine recombinase XerC [Betaproteobacteria bacterium]
MDTPLPSWAEDYLVWLATHRRAASLTLESYRRDLLRLAELAGERAPQTLEAIDIRRFVARLHGQGLSGRSIARALSVWRGLYRWLIRNRGARDNPAESIRPPKSPAMLPKALSQDQAKALLDAGSKAESALEIRDRAMFELFYSSGLRLGELVGLDLDSGSRNGWIDFAESMVTVHGKRDRMRTVPVGEPALLALRAWMGVRASLATAGNERALFITRSGQRMSAGAIRGRLRRWVLASGLGVHVHPHMFRHSFASHLLQTSGDLRAVQELLGHASIRSTQVYTHLDFQHLAQIYDSAHPRARK